MNRLYLLANGPDRVWASCFDLTSQRLIPLLPPEGEPFLKEEVLHTRDWHDRMEARFPEEHRQGDKHWLVSCPSSLFLSDLRTAFELSLFGAGYGHAHPVAQTDAVVAYYENRHNAPAFLQNPAGAVVLTVGKESIQAEWLRTDLEDVPTRCAEHLNVGTGPLDEALVELCLPPYSTVRDHYDHSSGYRRLLQREMRHLRQHYLLTHIQADGQYDDGMERRYVSVGNGCPDVCLQVDKDLLDQAWAACCKSLVFPLECFLRRAQEKFRTSVPAEEWFSIEAVLCSGTDCRIPQIQDMIHRCWKSPLPHCPRIHAEGAGEAVARGMELLAPKLAKVHVLEEGLRLFRREDRQGILQLRKLHRHTVRCRLNRLTNPGRHLNGALRRWAAGELEQNEILAAAIQQFRDACDSFSDNLYYAVRDDFLPIIEHTRHFFLALLEAAHPGWGQDPELEFLLRQYPYEEENFLWDEVSHYDTPEWQQDFESLFSWYQPLIDRLLPHDRAGQLAALESERYQLGLELRDKAFSLLARYFSLDADRDNFLTSACSLIQNDVVFALRRLIGSPSLEELWLLKALPEVTPDQLQELFAYRPSW